MRFFLWPGALLLLTVSAFSQRVQISPAQAQQFEASLKANPNNRAARAALLDYYYLGGGNSLADAIESRRRHILWLIENTPEDELAGGPSATIDAAGYALADPQGFKLASIAWRAQIGKANVKPATLVNAAYFFKLNDKDLAISLLDKLI